MDIKEDEIDDLSIDFIFKKYIGSLNKNLDQWNLVRWKAWYETQLNPYVKEKPKEPKNLFLLPDETESEQLSKEDYERLIKRFEEL